MYSPGKIIYFDPFYFKNGDPSKAKYFIVLVNNSSSAVIASLPTRRDSVPSFLPLEHGCINRDDINFSCYHFEKDKIITTNNWGFDLPTFIYGAQLGNYDVATLKEVYEVEGTEYINIGTLKKSEYWNIIECFSKSKSVSMKYRRLLLDLLKTKSASS